MSDYKQNKIGHVQKRILKLGMGTLFITHSPFTHIYARNVLEQNV